MRRGLLQIPGILLRNRLYAFSLVFGIVAFAFAGFLVSRLSGGTDVQPLAAELTPEPTNHAMATIDGVTVDTSNPGWMEPLQEAEARKPRYDQVINGIAIGPSVQRPQPPVCTSGDLLSPDQASRIPELVLQPTYLPAFSELDSEEADGCQQQPVAYFTHYFIPADPNAAEVISRKEASWFEVRHGSIFHIIRRKMESPALRVPEIASDRWEATTIAGKPAAIGRPILGSLGPGMVLQWDDENGVLTQVSGDNIALAELIRIAEGLQ